jgi:hypothetical protein
LKADDDWIFEENRRLRKLLKAAHEEMQKRPVIFIAVPVCRDVQGMGIGERGTGKTH